MLENLTVAFQGVWNHKLRSFLTMLGIIIGIASIITIVSTIRGTSEQIKANLVGAGTNGVTVQLNQDEVPYNLQYNPVPPDVIPVTEETRQALLKLDHVEQVSLFYVRNWVDGVYAGDNSYNGNLYGVDEHFFSAMGYRLAYGRGMLPEDFSQNRKVVWIDTAAVTTLFSGTYPIGQMVEILGEPFCVVGVLEPGKSSDPDIHSLSDYYNYYGANGGQLYVPDTVWPIIFRFDEPQTVLLTADETDNMTRVGQKAAQLLTDSQITNSESNFSYRSLDLMEQAEQLQELSNTTNRQLLFIASISLLVGGIGVMNIMLVTVTERTNEIGLKKAIGARKKRILWQFLTEAAVLTSFGGVLGILCGIVMSRLISAVLGTPTAISVSAAMVALLFSMFIGILFGLLPAVKAANLNPIDALRRD